LAQAADDAEAKPGPACAYPTEPAYSGVDSPPNQLVWRKGDPPGPLSPTGCSFWGDWHSTLLVALAGSFSFNGSAADLALRFGAISTLRGVKYWSVTDAHWEVLILDASAVSGADNRQRRSDFNLVELQSGHDLYFEQRDNRSAGQVVYRARVDVLDHDRVEIAIENVTDVSLFLLALFNPGDLHSRYILERLSPKVWGFYSLTGVRAGMLVSDQPASYINRAIAIYRHILGIPTDQDPPASP
jgi:hypothetical protein